MFSGRILAKSIPVWICVLWAFLIVPHGPADAANNKKLCNQPWDCESDCSCSNFQVNGTLGHACIRTCIESVQNVNKHKCKSTGSEDDNCPSETMKNCGKTQSVSNQMNESFVTSCSSSDYGNWVNCNNTWSPVSSKACD